MSAELERWRSAFLSGLSPASGPACPAPDELWRFVRGELSIERSTPLVTHSAGCSPCTSALRIALEMREASHPPVRKQPRPWVGPAVFGVGAAAMAVAAFLVLSSGVHPEEPVRERGTSVSEIRSLLPPDARPRSGLALEWSPVAGALRYQVTLATPGLQPLFQKAGVRTPRVEIPEAVLSAQPSGAALVWRVEAVMADGRTVESPAFPLVLR